jgi:hypothetical protein
MKIKLTKKQIKKLIDAELTFSNNLDQLNEEKTYETVLASPGVCKINIFDQDILNFLLSLIVITTPGLNIFMTKSVCNVVNKMFGGIDIPGINLKKGSGRGSGNSGNQKNIKTYFRKVRTHKYKNAESKNLLTTSLIDTTLTREDAVEHFEKEFKKAKQGTAGLRKLRSLLSKMHPDYNEQIFATEFQKAKEDLGGSVGAAIEHAIYQRILNIMGDDIDSKLETYIKDAMISLE